MFSSHNTGPFYLPGLLRILMVLVVAAGLLAACGSSDGSDESNAAPGAVTTKVSAPVSHVFIIVLENKGFEKTFGADSEAPYLARTLRPRGELLTHYYGIGHFSLDNYIAMISGQAPNLATQSDCRVYSEFEPTSDALDDDGQLPGAGCVYPAVVETVANQLMSAGFTWKGYMEDMGTDAARDNGTTCAHPAFNSVDPTQRAQANDQYAVRHNPFAYFHAVIDTPACDTNVVPLHELADDLMQVAATPNYSFITPDICSDGHDAPCADGRPGGLASADEFLREWVPRITASPAFKQDGLLLITFDEAEDFNGDNRGSDACCGERTGPNLLLSKSNLDRLPPETRQVFSGFIDTLSLPDDPAPGITGPGGGLTGTLVLSPFVRAGSTNDTPFNHYSMLRSVEDLFGLAHLGFAGQTGLTTFSTGNVFNTAADAQAAMR